MSGTFNVTLDTPFGPQKGVLTLTEKDGSLNGSIRAVGSTSLFSGGKVSGNSFEFSGILHVALFRFRYTAKGTVDGDTLRAVAETGSGTFQMRGIRVS
jgi:hypothetical protein